MPFTCLPREPMPIFLGVIITKRFAAFALTFGEKKKRSIWHNLIWLMLAADKYEYHWFIIEDLMVDLWLTRQHDIHDYIKINK